ncbi:MAG: hypothetical protein HAW66_01335 [Shewanella sp.]|nr:hypothetical protein [Shewanella sp.]
MASCSVSTYPTHSALTLPGGAEFSGRRFHKFLCNKTGKFDAGPKDKLLNTKLGKVDDLKALESQLSAIPLSPESSDLENKIIRFFEIRNFFKKPVNHILKIERSNDGSTLKILYRDDTAYEYELTKQWEQQKVELLIAFHEFDVIYSHTNSTIETKMTYARLCAQRVKSVYEDKKESIKAQLKCEVLVEMMQVKDPLPIEPSSDISAKPQVLEQKKSSSVTINQSNFDPFYLADAFKLDDSECKKSWNSKHFLSCSIINKAEGIVSMNFVDESFTIKLPPLILKLINEDIKDADYAKRVAKQDSEEERFDSKVNYFFLDVISFDNLDDFLEKICSNPKVICTQKPIYQLFSPLTKSIKENAEFSDYVERLFSQCDIDDVSLWEIFEFYNKS